MKDGKETKALSQVTIYTDGGCEPNPGVGGWGAVLIHGQHERRLSGGECSSTNNRMEMTAAIAALTALKRPCEVQLYSDSNYLVKGISEWIHKWKRNNWRSGGKEVLNKDLWIALDEAARQHRVHWHWVRGHQGNHYNEICDQLAGAAIAAQRSGAVGFRKDC